MEEKIIILREKYVSDSILLKYIFESFFEQEYPRELIKVIVITSFNLIDKYEMNFDAANNFVIIGNRGTGKLVLIINLINHLSKNINDVILFSTSNAYQEFYKENFPQIIIYSILDIFRQNVTLCDKIIIFEDDMIARINRNNDIHEFIIQSKYYRNIFLTIMTYPHGLSPIIRENQDYVIMFKEKSLIHRKRFWENYAPVFKTFGFFEKVFTFCTNNDNMMVIDNRKENLFDQVFPLKINSNDTFFDMIKNRKNLIQMMDNYSEDSHSHT